MVQILDKNAYIFNPPSITFEKSGESTDKIIELYQIDLMQLICCFKDIFNDNFIYARNKYNQKRPENFRIYRGIVHYLIKKRKVKKLVLFIKLNLSEHGFNIKMMISFIKGIVLFPAQFFLDLISDKKKSPNK